MFLRLLLTMALMLPGTLSDSVCQGKCCGQCEVSRSSTTLDDDHQPTCGHADTGVPSCCAGHSVSSEKSCAFPAETQQKSVHHLQLGQCACCNSSLPLPVDDRPLATLTDAPTITMTGELVLFVSSESDTLSTMKAVYLANAPPTHNLRQLSTRLHLACQVWLN